MKLHFASRIVSKQEYWDKFKGPKTNELFTRFAKEFEHHYGEMYCVSNVHLLQHIPFDVENHGVLENFWAFPFENYMGKIAKYLKAPHHQLQQVVYKVNKKINLAKPKTPAKLYGKHKNGPLVPCLDNKLVIQFQNYQGEYLISLNNKDNTFKINDEEIAKIVNIIEIQSVQGEKSLLFLYSRYQNLTDYYQFKLDKRRREYFYSKDVGIYKSDSLESEVRFCTLDAIGNKYFKIDTILENGGEGWIFIEL